MKLAIFVACLAVSATSLNAAPVTPTPSPTLPLYYDLAFSFNNLADGAESVSGIVRGLSTNGTSAAYSLEITSNTNGYGLGEYIGNPFANSWVLSGGSVVSFDFASFGALNGGGQLTSFVMSNLAGSPIEGQIGLDLNASGVETTPLGSANLQFSVARGYDVLPFPDPITIPVPPTTSGLSYDPESGTVQLSPVPLPAAAWLVLAGLGALALLCRRHA